MQNPQELLELENRIFVLAERTGIAVYDFDFSLHFRCRHPIEKTGGAPCILRVGAIEDYGARETKLRDLGLSPVNTEAEHLRASELAHWYPLITEELTPRSRVYPAAPDAAEIEQHFKWPVFIKGSRQTSRHQPALAVAANPEQYAKLTAAYRQDPILRWQQFVVREFVNLEPVPGGNQQMIRPSREFRSFWWRGECIGWGRYWYEVPDYSAVGIDDGLRLAEVAAQKLAVPFLVIDIAKRLDGKWTIIECNDAQESGYAAIHPASLWRGLLDRLGS